MNYYAGIDVSLEEASVCAVDATGKIVREGKAKKFVGTSVELDAIPAAKLRELVRECIERHHGRDG
jgi:hypothetical protein